MENSTLRNSVLDNRLGNLMLNGGITVQIVSTSLDERTAAAVKIQKVFKGLTVRKIVKTIRKIFDQVDEMRRSVLDRETVDLIGRDVKERIKVNGMIMNWIFCLDSIRSANSALKYLRKMVIKKAISLQETVDAIVTGSGMDVMQETKNDGEQKMQKNQSREEKCFKQNASQITLKTQEMVEPVVNCDDHANTVQETLETANLRESIDHENKLTSLTADSPGIRENGNSESASEHKGKLICIDPKSSGTLSEGAVETEFSRDSRNKEEKYREDKIQSKTTKIGDGKQQENNRKKVKKTDIIVSLISDLREKNEMQILLINALTQRIDRLERIVGRIEKRKNKKRKVAPV